MSSKKINTPPSIGEIRKSVHTEERQLLSSLLIQRTEEEILKQYSDYNLDRENEKFELLSGVTTSWKELREAHEKYKRYIAAIKREYTKTFPNEIYNEWRRLNGWNKGAFSANHKPPIFAMYTVWFIYGRFPKEIYATLDEINEFSIPGIRRFKHFELLTDEGYGLVKQYINDVISIANECTNMYQFRVRYARKYGVPFQLSIFSDHTAS